MQLTGRENIIRRGLMMRMSMEQVREKLDEIMEFAELGSYIDMPMQTYSSGMRARLGFAVTTSVDADVLVMDEWIGAGDARFIEKCEQRLSELIDRSRILVLASHNHKLLERACNRFAVLDKGRVEDYGDFEQLKDAGAVRETSSEKLDTLRKRFVGLKRENRQLKKQIDALKPDDPAQNSGFEKLRAENSSLKRQLKNRRERVQQLKAKVDDDTET
jgi:ABC-type multidrug transport system ATPase subunit